MHGGSIESKVDLNCVRADLSGKHLIGKELLDRIKRLKRAR